jgi:hypothetical protein
MILHLHKILFLAAYNRADESISVVCKPTADFTNDQNATGLAWSINRVAANHPPCDCNDDVYDADPAGESRRAVNAFIETFGNVVKSLQIYSPCAGVYLFHAEDSYIEVLPHNEYLITDSPYHIDFRMNSAGDVVSFYAYVNPAHMSNFKSVQLVKRINDFTKKNDMRRVTGSVFDVETSLVFFSQYFSAICEFLPSASVKVIKTPGRQRYIAFLQRNDDLPISQLITDY